MAKLIILWEWKYKVYQKNKNNLHANSDNLASETLDIQIVEQNENARTLSLEQNYYNGEYTIELYDENTTLVRQFECGENTPYLQIPVSGLTPGYYYLRLIINNQLIDVKHDEEDPSTMNRHYNIKVEALMYNFE